MREYELIYIIQPDASDEREREIHARIDATIEGGQGLVLLRDDWGRRKLAYEVSKFQKGHYFQLNFLGDGKFIVEMERLLRIDPDVLRFLTVLATEDVTDVDARIAWAKQEAEEKEKRRAEREKIAAERAAAAAQDVAAPDDAVAVTGDAVAVTDDEGGGEDSGDPDRADEPESETKGKD